MKTKYLKIGLVFAILLSACSPNLLDKVNPNGGTPESYYSTADELTKGVNAVYAQIQGFSLTAREWFFVHDLRSDEMATGGGQLEVPRSQLLTGVQTPTNSVLNEVWNGFFRTIHRANSVIAGSVNTQNIDATLKARLVGEAKFLRAWAYSDLVLLWGGVPLYEKPGTALSDAKPRADINDIYTLIIKDLTDIQKDLPLTYTGSDLGRVTRGAAQALLARVLMFKGDYAAARTELNKIYDSKVYKLMDNYTDNFLEETAFNAESLFEIGFSNTSFNWSGGDGNGTGNEGNSRTQEYNAIGWRNLVPSDKLLAEYETTTNGSPKNDPRFSFTFYRIGDKYNNGNTTLTDGAVQGTLQTLAGNKEKISWRKYSAMYKNNETFYTGAMSMRIIRYAEVLLNLAECENELGNSSRAVSLINEVRNRPSVAMPPVTKTSKEDVFAAVVHEKIVELAGEQVRNRDIVRWRKQGKAKSEPISYFQANKQELLPIPTAELVGNASLKLTDQNPGY